MFTPVPVNPLSAFCLCGFVYSGHYVNGIIQCGLLCLTSVTWHNVPKVQPYTSIIGILFLLLPDNIPLPGYITFCLFIYQVRDIWLFSLSDYYEWCCYEHLCTSFCVTHILFFKNRSIVGLQCCVSFRFKAKWFSYICIDVDIIYSFSDYFPL